MAGQLQGHLTSNNIWDPVQSGFRAGHGTESALVNEMDNVLKAADDGHITLLVMLDLCAAFDILDHPLLIQHLREVAGVSAQALTWYHSFL